MVGDYVGILGAVVFIYMMDFLVSILSSARFKVANGIRSWGPSEIERTRCVKVHEGENTAVYPYMGEIGGWWRVKGSKVGKYKEKTLGGNGKVYIW